MTDPDTRACPNCGRPVPEGEGDNAGWCGRCRKQVVRRATVAAHVAGGLGGAAILWLIVTVVHPSQRSVLLWLILIAAVYFVLFRLVRRVAFEMIRARGVRPARED